VKQFFAIKTSLDQLWCGYWY